MRPSSSGRWNGGSRSPTSGAPAHIGLLQPADQPVDGVGERGADDPDGRCESAKPFVQRRVHVATLEERGPNGFDKRRWHFGLRGSSRISRQAVAPRSCFNDFATKVYPLGIIFASSL